jgi:putative transcriptional regulator
MAEQAPLTPGVVLAAAPLMWDPNFRRSVILLCENNVEGSFGLIVNRPLPFHSRELDEMLSGQSPELAFGGPVQPTSLHYLHDESDSIPGASKIFGDVFWGGDFTFVQTLASTSRLVDLKIRFFLGYAGWGPGQLDAEVERNDWIVATPSYDLIFSTDTDEIWGAVLERLGGHYALMARFPADPRLN